MEHYNTEFLKITVDPDHGSLTIAESARPFLRAASWHGARGHVALHITQHCTASVGVNMHGVRVLCIVAMDIGTDDILLASTPVMTDDERRAHKASQQWVRVSV